MILAIVLVVLIVGVLVLLHEAGHFVVARRNGIAVEEFGIGFPPRLFSKKVGPTVYSLNLLPLGGFVRMRGEDTASTEAGSFGAAGIWSKTKVLLAGVGMNALAAYILLLVLCITGLPPVIEHQFSLGQPRYSQPKQVMVVGLGDKSAAAEVGIKPGDIILSGNGEPFETERGLSNFTKAHAGEEAVFQIKRDNKVSTQAIKLHDPNKTPSQGYLGVTPFQVYKLSYGWWSPLVALGLLVQVALATIVAFGSLIGGLFVHAKVASEVTGPVGIAVLFSSIIPLGLSYVALFVASISISLAVINVLPVPALDGGRWALILVQKVLGRRLSPQTEARVHMIGFVALIGLMAIVTVFDIKRLH